MHARRKLDRRRLRRNSVGGRALGEFKERLVILPLATFFRRLLWSPTSLLLLLLILILLRSLLLLLRVSPSLKERTAAVAVRILGAIFGLSLTENDGLRRHVFPLAYGARVRNTGFEEDEGRGARLAVVAFQREKRRTAVVASITQRDD